MSRRKQSKPQQHLGVTGGEVNKVAGISEPQEGPATCTEDPLSNDIDDRMHLDQKDEMDVPDSASEVHICTNCRGEFIGTPQFLEHREKCTQKQVVLIMNDQKETKEIAEGTACEDGDGDPDIGDIHQSGLENRSPQPRPEEMDSREEEKPADEQQRPIDFSAQSMDQNENTRPMDILPETKMMPVSTSSDNTHWSLPPTTTCDNGWSLPATTSGSSTNSQVLSDITSRVNLGEKRNGIVKSFPSSVAVIQEQLYTLHQQHLQQMQIILQIQEKIQALVAESLHRDIAATPKENAKEADLPPIVKPHTLPVESTVLQPKPPHPNVPSTIQILQNQVRQTPSLPFPAFPLSSPHSPFDLFQPSQTGLGPIPNPLQVPTPLPYPGGLLSHRKGKSPNVSVFDPKFTDDAFFRHKCHFCHKVFGSDSALQIHIRSHTGERPFRCNICGNRFSTKGNLKVHFQRHQAQYPDVEMDITPYPPSPIPQDQQPLQPPSIDQVPMPSIPNESTKTSSDDLVSPYQPEMPSSQSKAESGEINNNDKLSEVKKSEAEDEQSDNMTENASSDKVNDTGRPSSAPSKVETSNPSPTESLLPATSDGAPDEKTEKSPDASFSVTSTAMEDDSLKSSETSKLQHLVESIEQKITEPNQCVICHKVLSCKNALQLHYRIHTGERPFKCKICGRTFTTKGNLKTHYSVHKTKPVFPLYHECPICHKNFANPVLLQQHLKLHAAEDLMMHSTFGQEGYFRDENELQRKPENLMESLQARFNYMEAPRNGDNNKHDLTRSMDEREETSAKRQKLSDNDTGRISSTQMEEDHHRSYQLGHPDKLADNEEANLEKVHSMNLGDPKLAIKETSNHSEGALDLTPKTTSSSPDSVRSDPLALTTSAHEHRKLNSEVFKPDFESGKISPNDDIELKPYTNGEMRQIFDSNIPSFLMGRHRNRSNTTCYFCGKTFACASALNIHYRSHTKERPFKCDVCCKGFSTRGNLKQHMLTHKIRDMPSQLLGVDMTATSNSINNANERNDSTTPGNNVQSSAAKAEETMESKRLISNRHQCSVCDKQFQSDSALQIHVRTHTGEKPYKCHICGRAFTTKGNMKVHLGTHMWNGGSRRGRRITMDPPLLMNHKENDIYRNDLFSNFRPSLDYPFFQYPPPHPLLNGFAPLGKPNEISVIQNPHNLGMHYPPSSDSSHVKSSPADLLSSGYPRSNSSGGSGQSSPDKKSYSPSAEVEHHLMPAFPPSSHSPAALNYLNLVRLSRGSESSERASPEVPSYLMPEVSRSGALYPPSTKLLLPNGTSMMRESPRHNLSLPAQSDVKTSMYNRDRPVPGHPVSESEARLQSPIGQEDVKNGHEEARGVENSLTNASRMVDQLQSQRA